MTELLALEWAQRAGLVIGGLLVGILAQRVVGRRLVRLASTTRFKWDDVAAESVHGLGPVWFTAAGVYIASQIGTPPDIVLGAVNSGLMIVLVSSVAFVGMRLAGGAIQLYSEQARHSGAMRSPTLVVNLAKGAIATLGVFIILQNLGIDITPLITALGIGGLAVALALQDTLGNLFAGVAIIVSRQLRPRDYVQLSSGEQGWVTDVKARTTTIQTFPDGNLVAVPNAMLASSIVKNYSFPRTALWVTVEVGVSYDSDLEHVEQVTRAVANGVLSEIDGGVPGEEPLVFFHSFSDSSIDFSVRMMVREFRSQAPIRHEFVKRLHRRFNEEGIVIPFPIRTLVMNRGETIEAPDR